MPIRTRPPVMQDAIIDHLRKRIVGGQLAPGDKLPSRAEIQTRFETSTVTVQRAFDRLIEYGFVTTRGRNGTFVADHPPHTNRYVLAFPSVAGTSTWVKYWTVLMNVAREIEGSSNISLPTYVGIDKREPTGDYERLLDDVKQKRLAGIIFSTNPFLVIDTPIMDDPDIARLAVMAPPAPKGVMAVDLDRESFFDKSLSYLAERKRRRVALLSAPMGDPHPLIAFSSFLPKYGMITEKAWMHAINLQNPEWAANLMLLMFRGRKEDRPEGLIITDDNLVEHACSGLVEAGCSVPDDLDVVAHCNFPAPTPSVLPVKRLGYDIAHLLKICVELIDRRRTSKKMPAVTMLPAVFESETTGGVR